MASAALKTLQESMLAKTKQADELKAAIDAEPDATKAVASIDQYKATIAEMSEIKSQIEELRGLDELATEAASFKSFATAANTVRHAGATATDAVKAKGKTEIDVLTGEIVAESGAGVLQKQQIKMIFDPNYSEGFVSWARAGGSESKMRGVKAATDAFREGVDSEGGYFVPAEIITGVLRREPALTRIGDYVSTVIVGGDKATLIKSNYSTDDLYSSAVRIYKTGEAQTATKSAKPQFGTLNIDVHGWTAEISISNRLLDDTNFDLMGYLVEEFRTACRNMSAQKILLGSGVGEHFGILTRAGVTDKGPEIVNSGAASTLSWDSLRVIKNKLGEQYDHSARYLFNKRSTLDAIEGFKDTNGRDLWPESQRAGGTNGTPGTLRGYNYGLEAFMPDIAAGAIPILLGDFYGYTRVARMGMNVKVLTEIEARNGQTVFLVEMREGGDVTQPWRLKALKIST